MLIQPLENTGYKYHPVYRFYGWEFRNAIKPVRPCGVKDLGEFYLALLRSWSADTCSARFRSVWSCDENPTAGQCTITAAIVREYFGGDIIGLPLIGGGVHSFNLINGVIIDLASEQFGKDALLDYTACIPVDAEHLLDQPDKQQRHDLLLANLAAAGV